MSRREFTKLTFGATVAVAMRSGLTPDTYYTATQVNAPTLPIPDGKRLPFGWSAFAVDASTEGTILTFPKNLPDGPLRLRLTVAIDTREAKRMDVQSAQSTTLLGEFDLRFAYATEIYELLLSSEKARLLKQEGIRLRLTQATSPIWFLSPAPDRTYSGLQAHVIADVGSATSKNAFWNNFGSIRSVQQFSWMEGCVTDGLLDWWQKSHSPIAKKALETHVGLFFDKQQRLVYENARSEPADGTIYGIECPLPMAALAQWQPNHPALDLLISYAQRKALPNGLIHDGTLTTEGYYTLAYPLAVLARQRNDVSLARIALAQLQYRQEALVTSDIIYQRQNADGTVKEYPNWGRGVVWYVLGTIRTLKALEPFVNQLNAYVVNELKARFNQTTERLLSVRSAQGYWHAFVGEPETGIDTSATAGIAAALALATRAGWLPSETLNRLAITQQALLTQVTPDGFLTGACQSNRGGIELQRNGYRVISQYAAGLMAQFLIALKSD